MGAAAAETDAEAVSLVAALELARAVVEPSAEGRTEAVAEPEALVAASPQPSKHTRAKMGPQRIGEDFSHTSAAKASRERPRPPSALLQRALDLGLAAALSDLDEHLGHDRRRLGGRRPGAGPGPTDAA